MNKNKWWMKRKKMMRMNENEREHQRNKPQFSVVRNIKGQNKEYLFLKTVKSMEELDNFKFDVMQDNNKKNNFKKLKFSLELLRFSISQTIAYSYVNDYAMHKEKDWKNMRF
jgi:hypothetical protein